ncbi:cytochrome c oxidase assembly protein [Methylocystis parvus]|uniref:cytochrome c oxidase assembly protein n=1 Tax=Methylocystis parvus TaxID=134 RepID=UPI003C73EBE5
MRKLTLLSVAFCAVPRLVFADAPGQAHGGVHGYAIGALLLVAMLYAVGLRRICVRGAFGRIVGRREAGAFVAGLLTTFIVTASPVSLLGEALFSAHMAQHLALMLICAPLFVAGRASVAATWALLPVARLLHVRLGPLRALWRALTTPLAVWIWFIGFFSIWHLPGLYMWALRSEAAHALEHMSFFVSAYGFWSVAFAPSRRGTLGYGGRALFVASAALVSGLPGALIAIAPRPLYAQHAATTLRYGLTPLEDQQLAGLVMWIPGGLAYIVAVLVLLALWMREAERNARKRSAATALVACIAASVTLAGCDDAAPWRGRQATAAQVPGGDPQKGAQYIAAIGCGACHSIPGVNGAAGLVGPPLDNIGRRAYIAGLLRNTPANLEAWLRDPQKIAPGNVMPNMGISEEQSRHIAAYLYTLR